MYKPKYIVCGHLSDLYDFSTKTEMVSSLSDQVADEVLSCDEDLEEIVKNLHTYVRSAEDTKTLRKAIKAGAEKRIKHIRRQQKAFEEELVVNRINRLKREAEEYGYKLVLVEDGE